MLQMATDAETQLAVEMDKQNVRAGDEGLWVRFYRGAVDDFPVVGEMTKKSRGMPRYVDAIKIQIQVPGDTSLAIDREARIDEEFEHNKEADNNRFPKAWELFKAGLANDDGPGMPLSGVAFVRPAQVAELRYFKVRTVEQLAALPDGNLAKLGPGYLELRKKAQALLQIQKEAAPLLAVKAELQKRDTETADLRAQVEELRALVSGPKPAAEPGLGEQMAAVGEVTVKRRGRKPKAQAQP